MSDLDLTRLIGTLSHRNDRELRRGARKRRERLIADLCDIAAALRQLKVIDEDEAAKTVERDVIPWKIDAWREDDGSWTAEVYADGHGFGQAQNRSSWHKAVDSAMSAANAVAKSGA